MGFVDAIASDRFSVLAEVDPPKGADATGFTDAVMAIRGRVDGVVVTDCAYGVMRMTPLAPARLLVERNVTPAVVLGTRDRNRYSFQGDLLGAWALGVREILVREGDDPDLGDQPGAKTAGDLDLEDVLHAVANLNKGQDAAGEDLEGQTDFCLGVALDISDDNSFNQKIADSLPILADRGVQFVVLGPTYDMAVLDRMSTAAKNANIALFCSVMLLKSVSMIRYLNNLPGAPNIPDEYLQRMRKAPVKPQAGMEIAAAFVKDAGDRCSGAVLHGLGWGPRLPEFLTILGR